MVIYDIRLIQVEEELDPYLASTEAIDWHNQAVQQKSREICEGLEDFEMKTRKIFEWVRDHIVHSKDVQLGISTYPEEREDLDEYMDQLVWKASEVLEAGHGICFAQSHLLAALLRVQGIPAGLCYQALKKDSSRSGNVVHGLNAVYNTISQQWYLLDARLTKVQYQWDRHNLAYEMNTSLGEMVYREVYAEPHPRIMDMLSRFTSRRVMWPYLLNSL